MGDILKEAIADAKAVRETALANAKMALEEAFTPQLQSMLSAKLKEDEFEDEEELAAQDEIPSEDPLAALAAGDEEPGGDGEDVDINIDADGGEDIGGDEFGGGEEEFGGGDEEEAQEEQMIELNGQQFRLVPIQEDDVYFEGNAADKDNAYSETTETPDGGGEDGYVAEDLNLEAIIKELEEEINEEDDEEVDEIKEGNAEDKDNAYDESDPGEDPNHQAGKTGDMNENAGHDHPNSNNPMKHATPNDTDKDVQEAMYEIDDSLFEQDDDDEEIDEQSDSSNIGSGTGVSQASAGDEEDPQGNKLTETQKELEEYKEAVSFLKDKLHEVNILNAKLLFTNKLFKEYSLNNNQKLKVVETFDRAQSTREIKLVYSTLAEQFGDNGSIKRRKSINETASAKSGSTKPSKKSQKVITEEDNVADRFKKLAGIING
jgi:hypothetical protein